MSVGTSQNREAAMEQGSKREAIERLCAFLPPHMKRGIFGLLLKSYGDGKRLAREIGCGLSSLHAWAGENGVVPDKKYMQVILSLALASCPEAGDMLRKELLEATEGLCSGFGISRKAGKGDMGILMDALDEKSREIIWHLWRHRHAPLDELAGLIGASSDMEVLCRLREVINPAAERILSTPILEFSESRIDRVTGEKVLFNWWLEFDRSVSGMEGKGRPTVGTRGRPMVDLFDEKDRIVIVAQLPASARVVKEAEVACNNHILKISLDKFETREAN